MHYAVGSNILTKNLTSQDKIENFKKLKLRVRKYLKKNGAPSKLKWD